MFSSIFFSQVFMPCKSYVPLWISIRSTVSFEFVWSRVICTRLFSLTPNKLHDVYTTYIYTNRFSENRSCRGQPKFVIFGKMTRVMKKIRLNRTLGFIVMMNDDIKLPICVHKIIRNAQRKHCSSLNLSNSWNNQRKKKWKISNSE